MVHKVIESADDVCAIYKDGRGIHAEVKWYDCTGCCPEHEDGCCKNIHSSKYVEILVIKKEEENNFGLVRYYCTRLAEPKHIALHDDVKTPEQGRRIFAMEYAPLLNTEEKKYVEFNINQIKVHITGKRICEILNRSSCTFHDFYVSDDDVESKKLLAKLAQIELSNGSNINTSDPKALFKSKGSTKVFMSRLDDKFLITKDI